MLDQFTLVQQLTAAVPNGDQQRQVNDFAAELGWRPSDRLELPSSREFTNSHLIVEHGLEYTAVISFLLHPYRFVDLNPSQQKVLVNASYNNLIDWNISVDYEFVTFIYNRYRPPEFHTVRKPLTRSGIAVLQSANFRRITSLHPIPDVPALDRAVIDTISIWKRQLGGELPGVSNSALSALFNAILFVRAAEDQRRYLHNAASPPLLTQMASSQAGNAHLQLREVIRKAMESLELGNLPDGLVEFDALGAFDEIDPSLSMELLEDFYRNRFARYYEFDFSLMSKHAMSKIYEHYVSVLRVPSSEQTSFIPRLAESSIDRSYGNVYTPEFIARFFARYLRTQLPLRTFQRLKVIDPACGSGIFLRAFLELQNELLFDTRTSESIRSTFENLIGIDVDPNACHATRLSLSLLSLVLLGEFPSKLAIINQESLAHWLETPNLQGSVDIAVANPPYVKFEAQTPELKGRIASVLGDDATGKPDLYLAILKMSLELLKPGGYGLFVLPETLLKSESAQGMRQLLGRETWIECLIDLTSIKIFEDTGVYTILLIFQKRSGTGGPLRKAKIVHCQGDVARALQDVLDDRVVQSRYYTIHETDQEAFGGTEWSLAPPAVASVLKKYSELSEIGEEYILRQGMNTGADDVFILDRSALPTREHSCFAPLLIDREMEAYTVPRSTTKYVFYPFFKSKPLDEVDLKRQFPKTWEYLLRHQSQLETRSAVKRGSLSWWRPERPRDPRDMLRHKLVTPHLVISPRFGFDSTDQYAISRAPMITSTLEGPAERDHLCYLLGILNSTPCFWDIARRSHVYSRGYSRLELATLKGVRIPSFGKVDRRLVRQLIKLVELRLETSGPKAFEIEAEIDSLVADLYGLTIEERTVVGMREAQ